MVVENDDSLNSMVSARPEFAQWVADNVDHNTTTLDGKNTFHGMGIIGASIGMQKNSWRKTEVS